MIRQLFDNYLKRCRELGVRVSVRKPREKQTNDATYSLRTNTIILYRDKPVFESPTVFDLYLLLHEYRHYTQYCELYSNDTDSYPQLLHYTAELDADVFALLTMKRQGIDVSSIYDFIKERHGFGITLDV